MNEETKEVLSVMKDLFQNMQSEINQKFSVVEQRFDTIESEITKIKTSIETETNQNIKLLVDGHIQNAEKLDKVDSMEKDIELVKFDVDIIKKVVTTHSSQLNKLGKVE